MEHLPAVPIANNSRANYRHAARVLSKDSKTRASDYFRSSVDPVIRDFLQSVAENKPQDVLSYMFAFSRKRLSERQLENSRPETTTETVEVVAIPVSTIEEDDSEEQGNAASKIQARDRGRNDRQKVEQMKKQKKKKGGKAKKMGSLLMKAKKDGSLGDRVDKMEAALEEN